MLQAVEHFLADPADECVDWEAEWCVGLAYCAELAAVAAWHVCLVSCYDLKMECGEPPIPSQQTSK